MGIKLTQQKKASEDAAYREHKRFEDEIKNLPPLERVQNDIGILKSWVKNTEFDIKHMGSSNCLTNKLNGLKAQIVEKEKELEKMIGEQNGTS